MVFICATSFYNLGLIDNLLISKNEMQLALSLIDQFSLVYLMEHNDLGTICLSHGERQKIGFIRMALSKADVWILDEPCSSLDNDSKQLLYDELYKAREERIIIIISHEAIPFYNEKITIIPQYGFTVEQI